MATVYMSLMGSKGLRQAAEGSVRNAHRLQERLCALDGVELAYKRPFFNEFLIHLPLPVDSFIDTAREMGLLPGIRIDSGNGLKKEALLVCATETTRDEDMDYFVDVLTRILE